LINDSHRLLGEPRHQPLPVAAVIRMLSPPADEPVPATRETAWLLDRLPLSRR
jgi:hypothetical protein